jgi:hypothetical protein
LALWKKGCRWVEEKKRQRKKIFFFFSIHLSFYIGGGECVKDQEIIILLKSDK